MMDLARHKRQAAVLQLSFMINPSSTGKLGGVWQMPEVIKFVKEQGGNR